MNQTTQEPLHDYILIIRDLSAVAGEIALVEDKKTEAASNKRHELLDGYIQKEQALLLKLRGLEQHRIKQQASLGWDGLTLRQILEAAAPEQRKALTPAFEELEFKLDRLQKAREASEQILKVRLRELELFTLQSAAYTHDGKQKPAAAPHSRIGDRYV